MTIFMLKSYFPNVEIFSSMFRSSQTLFWKNVISQDSPLDGAWD